MQLGSLETGLDSYSGSILCCVLSLALKKTKENLSGNNNEICRKPMQTSSSAGSMDHLKMNVCAYFAPALIV
jgi:hypothetical protein